MWYCSKAFDCWTGIKTDRATRREWESEKKQYKEVNELRLSINLSRNTYFNKYWAQQNISNLANMYYCC